MLPSFGDSSLRSLASRSVTGTPANSFWRLASLSSYDSVKVLEMMLSVSAASLLGFQSMGQSTPCLGTAWKASSRRRASSTLRPTVTLFNVIYAHVSGNDKTSCTFEVIKKLSTGYTHLLCNAFAVDDKHATQTNTLFLNQNAIASADAVGCITEQ